HERGDVKSFVVPDLPAGFYPLEELLRWNFLPTSSVMFRRAMLPPLPGWYFDAYTQDWTLYLLLARSGNICLLDQAMGVYRVTASGLQSRSEIVRSKGKIAIFEHFLDELDPKYHSVIRATLF